MIEYVLFVLGLVLLVKGAGYLVEGSSSLAKRWGVSSLVIGLSIVSFGTSMPELFVNVFAALNGNTEIAFGNIIGSNLSNILLVLGLTAAIYPLRIQKSTVWREIPFGIFSVLILFVVANNFLFDDGNTALLSKFDGLILLLFFVVFVIYLFQATKSRRGFVGKRKIDVKDRGYGLVILMILAGIFGLYFGGKWVVEGAVLIAGKFGFSEFLISATVIAIGTSLPELVTSIVAAMRKNVDLAVGNIVGSNILNILWILGVTALISDVSIPGFINFDLMFLVFASVMLFSLIVIKKPYDLNRKEGIFLLFLYAVYIVFIVIRG